MADSALTLFYEFARNKSLSASQSLGPTLAITRATEGRFFDSAGILRTAASGVARFDHKPSTGESLGLLVEEARTNIALRSETFQTLWVNINSVDTQNEGIAPDGENTATKILDNSTGGFVGTQQTITFATSTAHSCSFYVKKDQRDWCYIDVNGLGSLAISAFFDLTNGVVGATTGANNTSEFIEDVGNGWFRCGIVFTSDAVDTVAVFRVACAEDDNDFNVPVGGVSSIFIWGSQMEAGAFPTSYIPTVASSVTRNKDLVTTSTVDWYNAAAGTLYAVASVPVPTAKSSRIANIKLDSLNRFYFNKEATLAGSINSNGGGGSPGVGTVAGAWTGKENGTTVRMSAGITLNDLQLFIDGSAATQDTSVTMPVGINDFRIGADINGNSQLNGHIAEIRYYNVRKDNQFLEDLSNGLISEEGLGFIRLLVRQLVRNLARNLA